MLGEARFWKERLRMEQPLCGQKVKCCYLNSACGEEAATPAPFQGLLDYYDQETHTRTAGRSFQAEIRQHGVHSFGWAAGHGCSSSSYPMRPGAPACLVPVTCGTSWT